MASHYRDVHLWTTILIFLVMVNVFLIDLTDAKKRHRQSRTIRLDLENRMADLQCRQNEQIINVNITSHNTTDCQGLPSNILADRCNCYWKESCTLKFDPTDYIIPTYKRSCPGRRVNALDVSYICKPSAKITLYHSSKWPRKEGILRSHEGFPWDHRGSLTPMRRSMGVGHRRRLVVTLLSYDLGDNQLSIGNHTFTGQNSQPETVVINRETLVYFDFIMNDPNSGANGFVFCYKVLRMKKSYINQTACELIKRRGKKSGQKKRKNRSRGGKPEKKKKRIKKKEKK